MSIVLKLVDVLPCLALPCLLSAPISSSLPVLCCLIAPPSLQSSTPAPAFLDSCAASPSPFVEGCLGILGHRCYTTLYFSSIFYPSWKLQAGPVIPSIGTRYGLVLAASNPCAHLFATFTMVSFWPFRKVYRPLYLALPARHSTLTLFRHL